MRRLRVAPTAVLLITGVALLSARVPLTQQIVHWLETDCSIVWKAQR